MAGGRGWQEEEGKGCPSSSSPDNSGVGAMLFSSLQNASGARLRLAREASLESRPSHA